LEALTARGFFSASFVLAYVFVVPPRPHELPLGGTMPTSTQVFLVGLMNLILSTLWSYSLWLICRGWMRDREAHAKWWHAFVHPPTWRMSKTVKPTDTTRKTRAPNLKGLFSRKEQASKGEAEGDGALSFDVGRQVEAEVAPQPSAPSMDAADERDPNEVALDRRHGLLGIVDLAVWILVNVLCLIIGLVQLKVGQDAALAQVDDYAAELS